MRTFTIRYLLAALAAALTLALVPLTASAAAPDRHRPDRPDRPAWTGTWEAAAAGTVDELIRHGGVFDAVVDFDAVVRDPTAPDRILPAYDSGDHLHFNDAGLRAMADAVDLNSLTGKVTR